MPRKKKITAELVYPVQTPVDMVEVDRTEHDAAKHNTAMNDKSQRWYDFWGKKCPVCGVPAKIVMEPNTDENKT